MELSDLSLNQIHILAPVSNDSLYEFPLKYKEDNDDKEIIFKSKHVYRIHLPSDEDSCELHIRERTELKFFSDLYRYLNNAMYDIHENYFESSFERKEYNKLFKNYLFPNIEENAVNIYCHIEPSVLKEHLGKKCVDVIPTFHLKSIVYDQPSFYIALELKDVEDAQETSHE